MNFRYDRSIETYEKNIYIKKYRLQQGSKIMELNLSFSKIIIIYILQDAQFHKQFQSKSRWKI